MSAEEDGRRSVLGWTAKGGVDDRPAGGEYEFGIGGARSELWLEGAAEGLRADTGRVTTLIRELGRRTRA